MNVGMLSASSDFAVPQSPAQVHAISSMARDSRHGRVPGVSLNETHVGPMTHDFMLDTLQTSEQ